MKVFWNRHKNRSKKQILFNRNKKQIFFHGNLVTGYEEELENFMKDEKLSYFKCLTCGNEIKWK